VTIPPFPRRVAILGSTGSIGRKAISVAKRYPDRIQVVSLAARRSAAELARQATEVGATRVAITDAEHLPELTEALSPGVAVDGGADAVTALVHDENVDLVVNGIVGRAGLEASLETVERGKMLAIANKESVVLAGELLMDTARRTGATVIPVDSEHSGLFQCLEGRDPEHVSRLIITASGGPFRGQSRHQLGSVTPEQALAHPVWPMGPRISVDSATLFNKGLEVIETYRLFGVPLDRIEVWVHPQSVVHALVEMTDRSMIAQVSAPDMLMPVQYAMSYPDRWATDAPIGDLPNWGTLGFEMPDRETFPALDLAYRAAERGGTSPTVLNAADEVAVEAFLEGHLPFLSIADVVEEVLEAIPPRPVGSLDVITSVDRQAREKAHSLLKTRSR
jgi:1-deoxy-D-xylulose-5-phosphate reductoisomerase